MGQIEFYRYVDDFEADLIRRTNTIGAGDRSTWYSPDYYDTGGDAEKYLAMSYTPTHRVGPIPADEMPHFDHTVLRPVAPANGQPGGGIEGATTNLKRLFAMSVLNP